MSRSSMNRSSAALRQRAQLLIDAVPKGISKAQIESRSLSLYQFVKWMWPIIEPATTFVDNWHIGYLCEHLEALLLGTLGKQNLLAEVPPGFMKSTIFNVAGPTWAWINRPSWRALLASGNDRVSTRDSVKRRHVIDSEFYRRAFAPAWSLSSDANLKNRYENTATGFHQALTTGQRVTGDRADALFVDDPSDASKIHSEAEREATSIWYHQAFSNRLSNMSTGTRCLIMQRLHTQDLAGLIREREGSAWEIITIPMEWDESRRTVTSLGRTDPRTDDGELAFPLRFPKEVVQQERQRLGRSAYSGQHQQLPFSADGEIFKPEHIQLWPVGQPMPEFRRRILSLDTAFSIKSTADYSVILELGEFDRGVMIINCVRKRMEYPQLKNQTKWLGAESGIGAVLIEDAASGRSLVQDMRQSTGLPVIPIKPDSDKVSRAHVVVPTVEAGKVYAPADAPWLRDFLTELASFPKGSHDDQVDAFTQGITFLIVNRPLQSRFIRLDHMER